MQILLGVTFPAALLANYFHFGKSYIPLSFSRFVDVFEVLVALVEILKARPGFWPYRRSLCLLRC